MRLVFHAVFTTLLLAGCKASPEAKREIEFVTKCEMALQERLVSESSFKTLDIWRYAEGSGYGFVERKFESTNGFGALLTQTYSCAVNIATKEIELLELKSALGDKILIVK